MKTAENQPNELKRSMKARHLFMISIGGCIGTGFFIGSGYTIHEAGAFGAILSYIVGGFIMYLTMLCLGELSVAMPVSGSFQTYATKFIGPNRVCHRMALLVRLGRYSCFRVFGSRTAYAKMVSRITRLDVVCNLCFSHIFTKRLISKGIWRIGVCFFQHKSIGHHSVHHRWRCCHVWSY